MWRADGRATGTRDAAYPEAAPRRIRRRAAPLRTGRLSIRTCLRPSAFHLLAAYERGEQGGRSAARGLDVEQQIDAPPVDQADAIGHGIRGGDVVRDHHR